MTQGYIKKNRKENTVLPLKKEANKKLRPKIRVDYLVVAGLYIIDIYRTILFLGYSQGFFTEIESLTDICQCSGYNRIPRNHYYSER